MEPIESTLYSGTKDSYYNLLIVYCENGLDFIVQTLIIDVIPWDAFYLHLFFPI